MLFFPFSIDQSIGGRCSAAKYCAKRFEKCNYLAYYIQHGVEDAIDFFLCHGANTECG